MERSKLKFLTRLALPLAICGVLAGCGAMDVKQETVQKTEIARKGPEAAPQRTITKLDENLIHRQNDFGVGFNPFINIGVAKDAASAILGLDLTILKTDDMSVLAGATSRNSVVIFKEGKGFDADASIKKFGINFNMSLSKTEGQSQALRTLVELAAIELFGKLTKTPYW